MTASTPFKPAALTYMGKRNFAHLQTLARKLAISCFPNEVRQRLILENETSTFPVPEQAIAFILDRLYEEAHLSPQQSLP